MRLVLDTHALIWYVGNDPKLSRRAVNLLENLDNEVLLSLSSLLEIVIKVSTGKLSVGSPMSQFFAALHFHHRDPFDRIIVAQCLAEGIPLLSGDATLDGYGVQRLW